MNPSEKLNNLDNSDNVKNKIELSEEDKKIEGLKAGKEIVGKEEEILRKSLLKKGDPNDPEYMEIANKVKSKQDKLKKIDFELNGLKQGDDEYSEKIIDNTDSFFTNNEKFKDNEDYQDVVKESFKEGLNEDEVLIIVEGDYEQIGKLDRKSQEKIYKTMKTFKSNGIIDGEKEPNFIEGLKEFLRVLGLAKFFGFNNSGEAFRENYETYDSVNIDSVEISDEVKPVLEVAISQLGLHESNRESDKFFKETGFNLQTDKVPWCASFVNWTLEKSGHNGTGSNMAKSFIGGSGYGHVGFKVGDKLLGGNQGNKVCLKNINESKIAGWIMPENVGNNKETHRKGDEGFDVKEIPEGAIIVYNRSVSKDKDMA